MKNRRKNNYRKRIVLPVCIVALSLSLTACTEPVSEPEAVNGRSLPEMAAALNVQEAEAEVSEEQYIEFEDWTVKQAAQLLLGKEYKDLTQKEVLTIKDLDMTAMIQSGEIDYPRSVTTLNDLKWFQNLKTLRVEQCMLTSLEGIESLENLEKLDVSDNNLTDITPVSGLKNLTDLDCAGNAITDFTPLSEMPQMQYLRISYNEVGDMDISFLENMTGLKSLGAEGCGISDISPLKNLQELEYLELAVNNISNISVISELGNLKSVGLVKNKITDIEPVFHNLALEDVYLDGNPVPDSALQYLYFPEGKKYVTYAINQKLRDDMPEFTFTLEGFYDKEQDRYAVETLSISDGEVFQNISISELAFWEQTHISHYRYEKDEIFEFEDMNFDGYLDMRLYDALNGPYEEWIYFIWNPQTESFEHADWLEGIQNARFDQEEQLIYGMKKGGAKWHTYYTYQYVGGRPALIKEYGVYGLWLSDEEMQSCLSMASLDMKAENIEAYHEKVLNRNAQTGEMEVMGNEYVFYQKSQDSMLRDEDIVLRVNVDSEIGQVISCTEKK